MLTKLDKVVEENVNSHDLRNLVKQFETKIVPESEELEWHAVQGLESLLLLLREANPVFHKDLIKDTQLKPLNDFELEFLVHLLKPWHF